MELKNIEAGVLNVVYEEWGPAVGEPVCLLHGFPYDVRAYEEVAPRLAEFGCRVIVPYLRGYGPTRFLSPDTPRSGEQAVLGNDLLTLLDALEIEAAVLGGYDWGGRAACIVAALWPERVKGLVSCNGYNIQISQLLAGLPHLNWSINSGISIISIASGVARAWTPIGIPIANCCGGCGRPTGILAMPPMTARPSPSKTRISST